MTLIITSVSDKCIVQVSDRRLTLPDGSLYDDMAIKMICVTCLDAHFSMSFTGLAEVNGVRTDELIVDYLASINTGNIKFMELFESLKKNLTDVFNNLIHLGQNRGITLVLSGYGPPGPFMGLLSNMEDEKGNWLSSVDDNFHSGLLLRNNRPLRKLDLMINGSERAADVFEQHISSFRRHYIKRIPSEISKATMQLIRRASRHPKVGHLIGRNCLSTVVMPDGQFICNDYPVESSPQRHSPHFIAPNVAYKKIEVWTGDQPPPWWRDGKD